MDISAVILAGGESRRMGRSKAWLELDGKPLLLVAVEKVRATGIREIFISGHVGEGYPAWNCPVLFDRAPGFGPLGGIERGLEECTAPLLLVLPVDLPFMTSDFLLKLVENCNPLTGTVPKLRGQWEPLVAIYPKRCHPLAREALTKERHAARDFASACWQERAVRVLRVSAADARCFANWNTPQDVARGAGE